MDPNRRKFLHTAAQTAATATALGMFPPVIAKALAIPAHRRSGSIDDVEHVVVLMQENRSFDHYFGAMAGVRGFGDRFTIPLPEGRGVWEQGNGNRIVMPYRLDAGRGNAQRIEGTPHSWEDAQAAWDHGRMNSWPLHKRDQSMGYYTRAELPFHYALADAFTVCDACHCAQHGGTNPNRLFLWTGSNGASAAGVAAVVNEWDDFGPSSAGYAWTTYAERLQAAGVSWKVYQNLPDNFTDNPLAGFRAFRAAAERAWAPIPGATPAPPYDEALDAVSPLLKGVANTMPDGGLLESLRADVLQGSLPQVSWIIAPEAYSEHPAPSCPAQGGWYMQEVLAALVANPEVWGRCVLIITFDENDGYFDHMPPPAPPSPDAGGAPAGKSTCDLSAEYFTHQSPPGSRGQPVPDGRPYGLGPRVPMFVVSPWSRGGWVNSQVFDHTSMIRFIERRFGVAEPNISAWRRAVAGDLVSAFNFANPDDGSAPPAVILSKEDVDSLRAQQERLSPIAPPDEGVQRPPDQAPGTRPSRALPYELRVTVHANAGTERVALDLANSGRAGAVIQVYDKLHLDRVPRRYTIEAGASLDDEWDTGGDAGRYELWLLGPNGFHRHVKGGLREASERFGATPEIALRYDSARCVLAVSMINPGARSCAFHVSADAYRSTGPSDFVVAPAGAVEWHWDLRRHHGWYDLTFRVDGLPGYARRVAGRLETGRHGISDPAVGGRHRTASDPPALTRFGPR